MFEPNISIIMPVFNAEKTLKKSIDSVLRQTVPNFEIICIDDGSSDSSKTLIKSLQQSHPEILLLEQNHQGAGPARNAGIKAAKGKYIAFLDADDDLIDISALDKMVKACVEHHASICGSFRTVFENGEERDAELFKDYEISEHGCFIDYRDFQHDYDYQSFIFDREFLVCHDIWFPSYMRYQDPPFFLKAMAAARQFYVVPVLLYRYHFDSNRQDVLGRYVNHILRGLYDTLEISKKEGYLKLSGDIVKRIDEQFHDIILQNLSDESMSLLLSVNEISRQFRGSGIKILSEIYKGMHDMRKLAYSHDLMKKIVVIKQNGQGFRSYFEARGIYTVAVYGLGVYGKILIQELKLCGRKIVCGIDRAVIEYEDFPVIKPTEDIPECDALIISLMEPEDVFHFYETSGNIQVYTFSQIIQKIMEETEYE